ncbi:MAG: methyltransferase regulatory domain-containing protein [Proteobacteria bacterium]|nr:methyltransferase regulatory domain-containing protein [Pseudomonadota bacterium]
MADSSITPMTTQTTVTTVDLLEAEYNAYPYLSFPFSHTHPTHLFTLAKLFNLQPKAVETAKVLELGCASGGNLIPMAFHFPTAEFLGIDLSEKQVAMGLKDIKALSLTNINILHQSISNFNVPDKYDYIICHGVYSWVDTAVREKILQICHDNLATNGIAYISYNTYPGWNMVNSVREMMSWHTKNISDPSAKAQQARTLLKFITDGLQDDKSPYAEFLKGEINLLSKQPDSYLLHDHLSSFNQPVYFYQFMEAANKQQLSYLSDAFLATMFTDNLPPQFSKELNKINNIIVSGQYMDFIRNQRFRSTLLCHQALKVNRALKTEDVEQFYLQLMGTPNNPNFNEASIQEGKEIIFTHGTLSLKAQNQLSQLALLILHENRYKPIHYNELCSKLAQRSNNNDMAFIKKHLNESLNLLRAVFAGIVNLYSYPSIYTLEVKEKPIACPLARYQAKQQNFVTNRRHEPVGLDPLTKTLLEHLDGTHDIHALEAVLEKQIQEKKLLALDENKQPIEDINQIKKHIAQLCPKALENMAKNALLIEV